MRTLTSPYFRHNNATKTSTISRNRKKYGPPWFCDKCCTYFKNRRALYDHKRTAHLQLPKEHLSNYVFDENSQIFLCKICKFQAGIKKDIESHVLTHEQAFTCEVCGITVYSAYKYSAHLYQHDKLAGYKCPLCDFKRNERSAVMVHIKKVHLGRSTYKCKHCGKGFDYIEHYKEHENSHVTTQAVSCVVCKKEFAYTKYLIYHQLNAHRVLTVDPKLENRCKICGKSFNRKRLLEVHMRIHQDNDVLPAHLCEQCGRRFKTKAFLTRHRKIHLEDKPHKCSYCAKGFARKNFLLMHERVHSGERPYVCDQCGKSFNQHTPLKRHIRSHTGEKPYICKHCGVGYATKMSLNKHVITTRCG